MSQADILKAHDLSQYSAWWNLPRDQQTKLLRDYWISNLIPREIQLSQESNRVFTSLDRELEEPFLTGKKKRALVTVAAAQEDPNGWHFRIPARTYEVWTLLCWERNYWLNDLIVPQKYFAQQFSKARKVTKDGPVHIRVWKFGERWNLNFEDILSREEIGNAVIVQAIEPTDITGLLGNYEPLQ